MLATSGLARLALLRHQRAAAAVAAATQQQPLLLRSFCQAVGGGSSSSGGQAAVVFQDGLPRFRLPLPSRSQACQFTLKPLTNSVEDLARYIRAEDRGVETVAFFAKDGVRIAGANSVECLLRTDFEVQLNDRRFSVTVPSPSAVSSQEATAGAVAASGEGSREFEEVKNSIAQLYTGLNVRDFQIAREKRIVQQLEALREEIQPLENVRLQLAAKASQRTRALTWLGLSYMGLQFGFLARLTWWEYSWDIMEPVIYFVGYGTVMVAYAYYVITKQEYTFPNVWDREYLKKFHSDAKRVQFDLAKYNELRERISGLESDLRRMRDPLMLTTAAGAR